MASSSANRETTSFRVQDARIKSIGLGDADETLLRAELLALNGRLRSNAGQREEAYASARKDGTPEANASFTAAVEARDQLTWESYQRLVQALSPKGAKKLAEKIAQIRTQMKAVGRIK
jgi:hypothetical protein